MKRVRLFHFDIPTWGNYGDKVLYPVIRDLFHGYGQGEAFRFVGSASLRREVTLELVERINACADAVVVGGGGLFLQDTNPNRNSGWQWNISREALAALQVPIVVFAVGNNRFPGQPEFDALLVEHATAVKERSVFFGLRNTGSIESMGKLLPDGVGADIAYQPCPTTLESRIYPESLFGRQSDEKALAVQMLVHRRQQDAGFDAEAIHTGTLEALRRLQAEGWTVWNTPFHPDDRAFSDALAVELPTERTRPLYGYDIDYRAGIDFFSRVPFVLGARGHAQMIPFGVGSIPLSLDLHDKLGFFASDIGHPELVIDARAPGLADRIVAGVTAAWEDRERLRADIAAQQDRMWEITQDNLAEIHGALGGGAAGRLGFRRVPGEHTDVESFHVRSAGGAEEDRIVDDRRAAAAIRRLRETVSGLEERLAAAEERTREREQERDEAQAETARTAERLSTAEQEREAEAEAHAATAARLDALESRGYGEETAALAQRTVHAARWRLRRVGRKLRGGSGGSGGSGGDPRS